MGSSFLPKCKPKITRISALPKIVALIFGDFLVSVGSWFDRAEILVVLRLHFGRNDDPINSFRI